MRRISGDKCAQNLIGSSESELGRLIIKNSEKASSSSSSGTKLTNCSAATTKREAPGRKLETNTNLREWRQSALSLLLLLLLIIFSPVMISTVLLCNRSSAKAQTIHERHNRPTTLGQALRRQHEEPLAWAGSNFTSYIADRDTNKTWPAGSTSNSDTRHPGLPTTTTAHSASPVQDGISPTPGNLIELTFYEDNDDDDDEDDGEGGGDGEEEDDAQEEEEALAALLNSNKDGELNREDAPIVDLGEYEEDEEDFYNRNPVESINWALKIQKKKKNKQWRPALFPPPANKNKLVRAPGMPNRRSITKKSKTGGDGPGREEEKFKDFDDFEALRLQSFYDKEEDVKKKKEKRKERRPLQDNATRILHKNHLLSGEQPSDGTTIGEGHKTSRRTGVSAESRNEQKRQLRGGTRKRKRGKRKRRKKRGKQVEQQVAGTKFAQQTNSSIPRVPAGSDQHHQQQRQQLVAAGECAILTGGGACVTFDSVEWALGQARRLIRFERPDGLDSLEPSEATIHAVGELTEWTSRLLAMRHGLAGEDLELGLEQVDMSRTSLWRTCPRLFRSPAARQCYTTQDGGGASSSFYNAADAAILMSGRYRTHTGQCNNPLVPNYGSSYMPFVRLTAPEYGDGLGSIRLSSGGGAQLPPARLVSLNLFPNYDVPSNDHSAMFAAWGQLINHDLALASGARVATGHDGACCARLASAAGRARTLRISDPLNRVCMPILIGPGDPVYAAYGVRCHDFKRSLAGLRPGCSLGPRAQLNLVTSFVDASFVYGSTRSLGSALRGGSGGGGPRRRPGQLAVWHYFGARRQPLLPPQREAPDDECLGRPEGLFCFRSGDLRTNQQVPLVAVHAIHTRQHNRLARALQLLNPHWSSERLYAEARHIHIAQVQHILLSEYLPELLGPRLMTKFKLDEVASEAGDGPHWDQYDPTLNPGISQEFAAAAFRQGHTSVPGQVFRLDPVTRAPRRAYQLRDLFRQPWALFEPGAMDEFLAGLVDTPAQGQDPFVSLELTGHLLEEPDEPVGLDLVAINIQRGRDQGVASYNSMRDWCGLGRLAGFHELARVVGNASAELMATLYESVDDIDLYSGGLSEWPLEGALLGPTFACVVAHQFALLRRADRYWFESSQGPHAFTSAQLSSIKQVPLARLVCANSDQLQLMQPLAMRLPHPIYNPLVACNQLPDLDLSLWYEPPPPASSQNQAADTDDDDDGGGGD